MQAKGRGFPSWGYVLLGIVAFAAYYFIKNLKEETLIKLALGKKSEVALAAMAGAKTSPRLLSHTGKILTKKFEVDKPGANQDSVTFRMILKGEKATATIKTKVVKKPSGEWKMLQSDTTYTD